MVFFNGTWNANYVFKSIQEFILKQLYIVIVAAIQGYIGHEVDSEVHSYHVYFSSLYEASFHVRTGRHFPTLTEIDFCREPAGIWLKHLRITILKRSLQFKA
ncbi:hypothetical protein C4D60_Mb03t12740 [Musa balbisiana]|uniref:Uncharacterized protein n=1 Tax=Musa balbisiana TaxID=52838 RepID=A0A4S8J9H2_MUSBA|nr:hypothetical protein C4D60_Mb03t12740 [Musa balbisiana]